VAREKMVVARVDEKTVLLEKRRDSMCGHCPARNICNGESQVMRLTVQKGDFNLKVGDLVVVETPAVSGSKLAFIVYTIPLAIFIVTLVALVGALGELVSFLTATSAMIVYYLILRVYDRYFRKTFKPHIIEVLKN